MHCKAWLSHYLTALLIMLSAVIAKAQGVADSTFARYKALNEAEIRLAEYKDDDRMLRLKLAQLALINKSRKAYTAKPVQLDILASRVANKMCREATYNNYLGHWNMAGEKPYHRYAFAGGTDHVSENASALWGVPFSDDDETIREKMKSLHLMFMAEKAPHDGHKKNCIDKAHNYVGLGFSMSGDRISYYEEFIDRYLRFGEVPATAAPKETVTITVSPLFNQYVSYATAYYEPFPKPMRPAQIESRTSYKDYSKRKSNVLNAADLGALRHDNSYTIPFTFSKKGLYYIYLYLSDKDLSKKKSYDTGKMIPASGIVIRVE